MPQLLPTIVIPDRLKPWIPTRALLLLLSIGAIDLVTTAALYSQNMIEEMNPLMRPLLETSVWLFVLVKGMTLALAYFFMVRNCDQYREFVRRACLAGSVAYVLIWTVWFLRG